MSVYEGKSVNIRLAVDTTGSTRNNYNDAAVGNPECGLLRWHQKPGGIWVCGSTATLLKRCVDVNISLFGRYYLCVRL